MNLDEIHSKNDYERKKRIIMQYRQSIDRRSQDFDILRFGKNDSIDTSRNMSRSDMDVSIGDKKDNEVRDSQTLMNISNSEDNKKENFKIPDKPKKTEEKSFMNEEKNSVLPKESLNHKRTLFDSQPKSDNNNLSFLNKKPETEKGKDNESFQIKLIPIKKKIIFPYSQRVNQTIIANPKKLCLLQRKLKMVFYFLFRQFIQI
jgi:hypothetical protein